MKVVVWFSCNLMGNKQNYKMRKDIQISWNYQTHTMIITLHKNLHDVGWARDKKKSALGRTRHTEIMLF